MSAFEMILGAASSSSDRWGGPGSGLTGKSDMITAGAMASLRVDLARMAEKEDDDEDNDGDPECDDETLARISAWKEIKSHHKSLHVAKRDAHIDVESGLFNADLWRYDRDVREAMAVDEICHALDLVKSNTESAVTLGGVALVHLIHPSSDTVCRQASIVLKRAANRNDGLKVGGRSVFHLHQLVAQHLDPLQPYVDVLGISAGTYPRTTELIAAACIALGPKLFHLKDAAKIERPHKTTLAINHPKLPAMRAVPMLDVPGHFSYPGGHSAKTFLAATILSSLASNEKLEDLMWRLAAIVGNNRVKAALHYPMDTVAGAILGFQVGRWLVSSALTSSKVAGLALNSTFDSAKKPVYEITEMKTVDHAELPTWRQMFLAAIREW